MRRKIVQYVVTTDPERGTGHFMYGKSGHKRIPSGAITLSRHAELHEAIREATRLRREYLKGRERTQTVAYLRKMATDAAATSRKARTGKARKYFADMEQHIQRTLVMLAEQDATFQFTVAAARIKQQQVALNSTVDSLAVQAQHFADSR